MPPEAVYDSLDTQVGGLSYGAAAARLAKFGANELPEPEQRPLWLKFLDQLTHLMAILLWVAAILAFISGTPVLAWAILAAVWIGAIFGFWQEFQAERAIAALKNVLPMRVKVYRDGELQEIPSRELVPGDVMQLEEGDRLSADGRLVSAESLYLDISVLTGESLPVARNAYAVSRKEAVSVRAGKPIPAGEAPIQEGVNPAEISNLVLAGSTIAAGRGMAVVYGTGSNTEFGQVAHLTTTVKRAISTLEIQVERIVRVISAIAVSMGISVFILSHLIVHMQISESFMFGIGIIVANVPEGLLPTVTLALAFGVQLMAKQNALVRKLSSVETLSAATVICTDKTGTLTKNEMTVRYLWLPENSSAETPEKSRVVELTGAGYDPMAGKVLLPNDFASVWQVQLLLLGAALCSNARLVKQVDPIRWQEIGDPTEAALLTAAGKASLDLEQAKTDFPRKREVPFDSRRRMMTVVLNWQGSKIWSRPEPMMGFTKGAPLEVLRHCTQILRDGQVVSLEPEDWTEIAAANDRFAEQGFRVLAIAARPGDASLVNLHAQELEQDLIFVGLVAMFDPPRPEVPQAIAQCNTAGIKVTMVTGDYGLTAEAIANQVGLLHGKARIVTGDGMGHLSDAQLRQILKYRENLVFARMSPEHKLRLVQAYKDIGEIVAVTGDGVNDAPALRAANIGIAMGLNGTDVAREAADIVLTDDNFATIVKAVEQGRAIYQNIRKFMTYILVSNMPEIMPFLVMVAFRLPPALTVLQILLVDLGTDVLPALSLGAEPPEAHSMERPPRPREEFLLSMPLILRSYCFMGVIESILAFAGFFWVWGSHGYSFTEIQATTAGILAHTASPEVLHIYHESTTMTLAAIVACQVGNLFACRSSWVSAFKLSWTNNKLLWVGVASEISFLLFFIYFPPIQSLFEMAPLSGQQLLALTICPVIILGVEELRKLWINRKSKSVPIS
jgi:Ca2+-transporting ATPase